MTGGRSGKVRLDVLLVERGFWNSREKARRSIMAGEVFVDGKREDKPGTLVSPGAQVSVKKPEFPYVSRGGIKLERALMDFGVDVSGKVAIDVGASTGGFVDVLLRHGARKVYAIDVGYGQLAWELRQDPRVVVMERTNVRYVSPESFPERADIITVDVSFISVTKFLDRLRALLSPSGEAIILVKPQFEAGRDKVGKKGVVRDPAIHREVLMRVAAEAQNSGFYVAGVSYSPIKGPEGNIEFFLHLLPGGGEPGHEVERRISDVVAKAHQSFAEGGFDENRSFPSHGEEKGR